MARLDVHAARHAHLQVHRARVQEAVECAQVRKGTVNDRCLAFAGDDAYPHGTLALELAMRAAADDPQSVDTSRHDVVVRPAQRAIRAEPDEGRQHQGWHVARADVEVHPQQGTLPAKSLVMKFSRAER